MLGSLKKMDRNNQNVSKVEAACNEKGSLSLCQGIAQPCRPISGLDWLRSKDVFMKKASTGIPAAAFQAAITLYGKIIFNKIVHLARAHNGHVNESLQ